MKKLLFIFLLMLLPFQYSWAAAAVYCQHEQEHPTHFGHHSHEHEVAQAKTDDKPDDRSSIKVHADCITCHGSAVGIMTMPFEPHSYTLAVAADAVNPSLHASAVPTRPERPQWSLAV